MKSTYGLIYISACLAFLNLNPAAAGSVFSAARSYPAGFGGATQSAAGDLNGDGVPDIVLINPCDSSYCGAGYASVAVLIANADGSFQTPVSYATGTFEPMSVAAADVNGDGILDLLVASQCSSSANCGNGQVSLLIGNGDGTFQSPVHYSTGAGASYFVAVGDFNADGNLDLAVANQTSAASKVSILLGNGDGTFQPPFAYATGAASAAFIAIGDFNKDGALDLAVANAGTEDSVSILLGNGDGTFQAAAIYASGGTSANAVVVSDFDGDGTPDLAVVNGCANYNNLSCSSSGSVGVLLGNGDGTFQSAGSYGSGGRQANSLLVADFDGDGRPDLAVTNLGSSSGTGTAGTLSLLLGKGDDTFQPAVTFDTGGNSGSSVTTSDFNGDGQPDIVVVNQCPLADNCTSAAIGVLLNTAANFQLHASSTSLNSSLSPAGSSQAVILTATVTPGVDAGAVTGNVTFYDGSTALSTVAVSNGQATFTSSFAAAGKHALQAAYTGDSKYATSASLPLSQIVGTPVRLASSLAPSSLNQPVTFSVDVSGPAGTPTGSVSFLDGGVLLSTQTLVNGTAALVTSSLTVGTHSITASYSGDINFGPGSATLIQTVSQPTTTTLVSSANPATTNQPLTYTATVTGQYGGVPGGAVAFMQGAPLTTFATAPLVNGQASISTAFNTQGSFPIAAVYLGSPSYSTGAAASVNQTVNGTQSVTTTTVLTSSGTPSSIDQPVTFTATVNPASGAIPNGEIVTFYNGTNTLGTGVTANGVASFTTSALPLGTNSITATYAGDATYQSSTSRAFSQVVRLGPTTTTLTSSLNPSTYGQSILFSVTVVPQSGSGTPTGTVTLKNGGTSFGSVALTNGAGSFSTSTLPAGSLSISATYSGDADFGTSSANLTQVINVGSTTTALTSTPNPSSLNQNVTFTATVTGQYGGDPSGTVTFMQGTRNLGTAAPIRGKASVTASFSTTGTFPVTATYSGDASNLPSASPSLNQVVGNTSTTTTVTSSGTPAFVGSTVTFTATVTSSAGNIPDNETVTFLDGTTAIGTGTTANGAAVFATASLAVGTHSITAKYPGDTTYQASTSRIFAQVVSLNSSVTRLASSLNPSAYGQSVTLTATVAAVSGSTVPTGNVTFKNGATAIASVALNNGSASYTSSKLAAGTLSLSASYGGNSYFSASSASLSEVVNQAVTTTTVTSNANPSSLGQTVTFTATVTGQYNGMVGGSVSLMNGSNSLGSAALVNGKASFTYAFAAAGTNPITAVYAGDANNRSSTSTVLSQVVTTASTTTTVSSSGSPAFVAQPVTLTATVSSTYGAIPNGELITFYDGSTVIGTGNTLAGAASMVTSSLSVGTHSITATYAGDSTFLTSTSAIFRQAINQQSTTTLLTSSANPAAYGMAVTFTATVTSSGPKPTGTVTFKNGATLLGTASLNSLGATTLTTLTLGAGGYSITASYSGDTASAKSTSAALNQVVTQAATTTQLYSSINPASPGASVTFTAIVRSNTTFATGSVTFTAGSQVLGTATLVNGTAKLALTTLPSGATNVTASYPASPNVAGSSATITQYVN